jgi:carnitine-CoA ligase
VRPVDGLLQGAGYPLGDYALRYPRGGRTIVRLLHDQASARGLTDWLVVDGADRLSFRGAEQRSNQFARAVVQAVGRGHNVAVFARNERDYLPALLGAMKAGGAAVPLNPELRGPLLQSQLERSRARVTVCAAALLPRLQELSDLGSVERIVVTNGDSTTPSVVNGVPVVGFHAWAGEHTSESLDEQPTNLDTALILFTSGTTGISKGVMISHEYLYLYSAAVADSLGRREDDVLMTPLPLCHVAALCFIALNALHAGCVAHLKSRFSASQFWSQAADDGATYALVMGPMAPMIMKQTTEVPAHRVETMLCIPPPPGYADFERRFGVRILWQGYGMTEIYPLPMRPAADMLDAPPDTIGYPATWMDYGVVDADDNMVAPGVIGELVFRPRIPNAMASGYFDDPAASLQATRNFMFHTGDLGYYDEDGCLHFSGRRKDRIRRRGENVSAGELEGVALLHPAVVDAAAYGVSGDLGDEEIKLDVVLSEPVPLPALHGWLSEQLPRFMVPRYLEVRDELPKTPSARTEKYRLAAQPLDRPAVHDFGLSAPAPR